MFPVRVAGRDGNATDNPDMSLVIEPMPDLGITRVSRWIFNCYVIHEATTGRSSSTPDCSHTRDDVEPVLNELSGSLSAIVATHGHSDHVAGAGLLAERHDAPIYLPAATLEAIERERCTGVYGVPTMFIAMLGQPDLGDRDLSSLRTGITAGATCPMEVMMRCINELNMSEVAIAYGMTEISPVSCQTLIDDDLQRRTATVGQVHPHVEIKIIDPDTGTLVKRGEPGEFCARGCSVMLG
jgi:AMP-binding enzyme/Metallo-beta-lactamase superfamily